MSDYVEDEDGRVIYWPMCPIKGCTNRICLRLNSQYCWLHTGSGKSQDDLMSELNEHPSEVKA